MTTSPMIERLEFPSIAPTLPVEQMAPPFASTINRLPGMERAALPQAVGGFGEAEWEKVAAGVLAGFGGGIVAAFALSMLVL
ncbi:MAG: hypothetical protein HOH95_14095 [Dehalococcoidia bacterium]|jgi:hypothetical protein|nr:hypothetical protein [Dehalococcoidia bacterium]